MFGLVIGSFLNVVIYRLPIMLERDWRAQAADLLTPLAESSATPSPAAPAAERLTLSTPGSACPACKAPIKAWQNIPVVSWLLLRGRCAACKAPRSPCAILWWNSPPACCRPGWPGISALAAAAACALLITWSLIALTGIDIDHQLLPDGITLPLMWAGLLAAVIVGPVAGSPIPVSAHDALIGAASGYVSLWLVFHAFRLVTGKEGMGYGDFKLFAALGAWLGWKLLPLVILLSAFTGAVIGILMIVLRGRDRSVPMPFGPYLAAAGWIAMMYGDVLVDGYLRVSGLKH